MAQVLRDPALDAQLRRDGFVMIPVGSVPALRRLRERYGDLTGWAGEGFRSDLVQDDLEYRRSASAAIAEELDGPATALFVDHEPFLRNFLCKYPGDDSGLYLHRDWMYVDERAGERTYVVWAPLQDVVGHNGQLRVLRSSHDLDREPRGAGLISPWLAHTEVIEQRLVDVPVPVGHVVVFDNAVAHASYPNHTDEPRVVAAVGLRRRGTPLVHFRRVDDGQAERFDVDEAFFGRVTPLAAETGDLDLVAAETLDVHLYDPSAAELAARLDVGAVARVDLARRRWRQARAGLARRSSAVAATARRARSAAASGGPVDLAATGARVADQVRRWRAEGPTRLALAVLSANERVIDRFGPATPAVWDPSRFEWARDIEAGYPAIRAEVDALLAGRTEIPHIEDVTGGIPQGNEGPWRSFVMMHQGSWIDWNCERCPETTALVRRVPGLTVAGFSVLEAGTHITEHRGPNKGALRYQLGVVVPGADGDCRIRVGDEMLVWREGEGVMFDFTIPHEAWNDSPGTRVLLMLEVLTPLPWYLAAPNRVCQRAMRWFPTTRDLARRLQALEPALVKPA